MVRADTLEELAEKLGTPGLVETVAAYNSYAAGEADPLGKAPEMIHAIGDGPYVAVAERGILLRHLRRPGYKYEHAGPQGRRDGH